MEDARNRFAEDVFGHQVTKDGKVLISWQGRIVTTVSGAAAAKLVDRLESADRRLAFSGSGHKTGYTIHLKRH